MVLVDEWGMQLVASRAMAALLPMCIRSGLSSRGGALNVER
jgi:hypothetical protein